MNDEIFISIGTVGTGSYVVSFTNQISFVIPGNVHNMGTADLIVQLYETVPGDPQRYALQAGWSVNEITYDITLTFAVPQTGRCVVR